MSGPPSGPGKTAPKIHRDFLDFDPLNARQGINILTDHAPPVGEGQQPSQQPSACRHDYTIKHEQSISPPLDLRPDAASRYKLGTVCKKCRLHAVVKIDYTRSVNPCPNSEYPLHHFQRLPEFDVRDEHRIAYAWQCSAPQCQAHLEIGFGKQRLSPEDRDLLINTELLKRRYESVLQHDPGREGMRQATPMEALSRLRKYIKDSLNAEHTRRSFPANNKRFMETFGVHGQDCAQLLQRLGFKYASDILEWSLPDPPTIDDRIEADGNSLRELLEDVEIELVALMYKLAGDTGAINPAASEGWPSASRDVERVLAAQGYPRHVSLRRTNTANEEAPFFSSLGALPDFADSLVEFVHDRQSNCDPEQQSYYFECLQVITESRNSEQLHVKVAMLQSTNLVSRRDLSSAYRTFGLSPTDNSADDYILNVFQARQSNVNGDVAEENRQALYKIGLMRNSQLLINASRQSVETYEDALAWIGNGATKDTDDEMLISMLTLKEGTAAVREIAQKAISVIAKERRSDMLNSWLQTGRTDGYTMSVDEALRYMNIEQKLEDIDQSVIGVALKLARTERPGEQTEKAIATIERALAGRDVAMTHAPASWPVGLVSHGNTCYLNSLLQYYFALKPLRDIVQEYDKYKLDLATEKGKTARVGGRQISLVEIKGGQRFAKDLQHLFDAMTTEPGTAVTPDRDMVCRAFLEPQAYHMLLSSAMDERVGANRTDQDVATDSALGPDAMLNGTESAQQANGEDWVSRQDSVASSATLQADEPEDVPMQLGTEQPRPSNTDVTTDNAPQEPRQPPSAPPLPPRRFSTTEDVRKAQREALSIAEAKAREQQDVTEVHDSVTFRLRSGMKPEDVDDSGEQQDRIRALYTIGLTQTELRNDGGASKPVPLSDSGIQVNVPKEETDIYSALDEIFDAQTFEGADHETFKSVRSLPPILQISIPRIGWDKARGTYKSEATVRLEDELYLDRYIDLSHEDVLPSRKRCWAWRKQLRELRKERLALKQSAVDIDLQGPEAFGESVRILQDFSQLNNDLEEAGVGGVDIDPSLTAALIELAGERTQRLQKLEEQISHLQTCLHGEFTNFKAIKYRLAAVFFHRGTQGSGHYWVNIKDFDSNLWRNYNDDTVQQVQPNQLEGIYRATRWEQGTPTYAVYVQDDAKEHLIQPVCRSPREPPPVVEKPTEAVQTAPADPTPVLEESVAEWDKPREVPQVPW
ncbi:hypothetical protein BAUCODRAFT_83917 [Baudoinia panamericana UAMH 10762]|uniref:ubiquitinyl hydrolase 1 n=1 Tax=Baudoinia panamericana (strain UAMH 10762) TaxID=717646 RepID=M2NLZ8_BAUPA|nr:uncharacterized protein BAUCODRAFT_83917 [Baudoinia panamericana UAMH 10762]EMD00196.1 hypothetical protein BAUCODRAFT_83917 [Baudoinia panamericana UAMH 10762]